MNIEEFLPTLPTLSDLDLAILVSLITREHCLLVTDDEELDNLAQELASIVSQRFALSYVIVDLGGRGDGEDELSSLTALLLGNGENVNGSDDDYDDEEEDPLGKSHGKPFETNLSQSVEQHDKRRRCSIPNVIIAKHFNQAPALLQAQMIELIEDHKRLCTARGQPERDFENYKSKTDGSNDGRVADPNYYTVSDRTTAALSPPSTFLFLPIIPNSTRHIRLTPHLNDRIAISHSYSCNPDADDQYQTHNPPASSPNTNNTKTISFDHKDNNNNNTSKRIQKATIDVLRSYSETVALTPETRRYLQDIVTFLRIERGVDGGITPRATRHFIALTRYFSPSPSRFPSPREKAHYTRLPITISCDR